MLHTKIALFDFITSIITINLPITCPGDWNAEAIFTTKLAHGARVFYNYKVLANNEFKAVKDKPKVIALLLFLNIF